MRPALNPAWNHPLGNQHGDEGLEDVTQDQLVAEVKARVEKWKDSVTPEQLDALCEEPLMVDGLRDLIRALIFADIPQDLRVTEAIAQLQCYVHDEVWSRNGGDEI